MVESIQSSHQVNSFPLQAAPGILPIDFAIPPFCLLQGHSTKRPFPVVLCYAGNTSSHASISIGKDSKTNTQPLAQHSVLKSLHQQSPSAELGMPSSALALLLVTGH